MNKRQWKKENKKRELFQMYMIFNYTDIRRFARAYHEYMLDMSRRLLREVENE